MRNKNFEKSCNCNLCGSSNKKNIFRSEEYPDQWNSDVVCCKNCGLTFRTKSFIVNSHISDEIILLSYPDEYTTEKTNLFNNYTKLISPYRKHNRILDIGSGKGLFVNLCAKQNWDVSGVEINPELVDYTKKLYDIEVYKGKLEKALFPTCYFDVVTFWNVFDHLLNPMQTLHETYRILRQGGAVFLRFPNASFHIPSRLVFAKLYKFWKTIRIYDHSAIHQFAFTRRTIMLYLKKVGFEDYLIQHAKLSFAYGATESFNARNMTGILIKTLADIIKIISLNHYFLSPSLLVKAVKA